MTHRMFSMIAGLALFAASPAPLAQAQEAITLEMIGAVRMVSPQEARRHSEDAAREQTLEAARSLRPIALHRADAAN